MVKGKLGARCILATMVLVSLAPLVWLETRPRSGTEVAAIFAPWLTSEEAFARAGSAGGNVVRQGVFATILVVHGKDASVIDHLYAAGAWAVIDPVAFGGCLVRSPGT
jgi:hypothetical protein